MTAPLTRADLRTNERKAYDNAKSPEIAARFLERIAADRAAPVPEWIRMRGPSETGNHSPNGSIREQARRDYMDSVL